MRNLILTLIIWIICFTAITIGTTLIYDWYINRGPDIYIHFKNVSGLLPNQSKIMYRGVQVGTVTDINIDLQTGYPVIKSRITRQAAKLLGKDSKFWIVSAKIGLGTVNNLSTITTGDYINMHPAPGEFVHQFDGLDDAPPGDDIDSCLKLKLKTSSAAGIEVGSGILYHDFQIGEVADMGLSDDKYSIMVSICIDKKYASVIRKNSYFSNVSGFHASLHLFGGSEISMNSLHTLVKGGIVVTTPNFKSSLAANGDTFRMLTPEQVEAAKEN